MHIKLHRLQTKPANQAIQKIVKMREFRVISGYLGSIKSRHYLRTFLDGIQTFCYFV